MQEPIASHSISGGRVLPGHGDLLNTLDELIRIPPFHRWLGVTVVRVDADECVLRVPPNDDFVGNPYVPAIHGGIVSALIDLAGGAVLFGVTGIPTPTIDMRVDYIRPAIAGRAIDATARITNLGSTVAFVDVDVHDETGVLVAKGRCTYSVKAQKGSVPAEGPGVGGDTGAADGTSDEPRPRGAPATGAGTPTDRQFPIG